jgi:hypothetical protein
MVNEKNVLLSKGANHTKPVEFILFYMKPEVCLHCLQTVIELFNIGDSPMRI